MGRGTFSRDTFKSAAEAYVPTRGPATGKAEQRVRETGKLDPLVDPKEYGVIRQSRPRFEQNERGLWELTVGTPMAIETRVDTTGSMGDNVDIALRVLPNVCDCWSEVLPGYDLQVATGIFGDIVDPVVLCRPQFEMEADKIVRQLTLMVPIRAGGDIPEDPHYGLFGAAYLTMAYIARIGLKSYDFTVTDAPARDDLSERQLVRIFGEDVFEKAKENGHALSRSDLPTTKDVVTDLLRHAHAFLLQVERHPETTGFWTRIFGSNRVVTVPDTALLPQVQGAIIGLTEGTLSLEGVPAYLRKHNVRREDADRIARSVARIPIGAQAALPNFGRRPKAGDLFRNKTDLWPIPPEELAKPGVEPDREAAAGDGGIKWI